MNTGHVCGRSDTRDRGFAFLLFLIMLCSRGGCRSHVYTSLEGSAIIQCEFWLRLRAPFLMVRVPVSGFLTGLSGCQQRAVSVRDLLLRSKNSWLRGLVGEQLHVGFEGACQMSIFRQWLMN